MPDSPPLACDACGTPVVIGQVHTCTPGHSVWKTGGHPTQDGPPPAERTVEPSHIDDDAVDMFAAVMKAKLRRKRREGYHGWDDPETCTDEFLWERLRSHVEKGDPVDIANFSMMLWYRWAMRLTERLTL